MSLVPFYREQLKSRYFSTKKELVRIFSTKSLNS